MMVVVKQQQKEMKEMKEEGISIKRKRKKTKTPSNLDHFLD